MLPGSEEPAPSPGCSSSTETLPLSHWGAVVLWGAHGAEAAPLPHGRPHAEPHSRAGSRCSRTHLAYGNQLRQAESSWHRAGKGRPGERGRGSRRWGTREGGRGWGQAQIGTVWAIEAPLSGGLWRARQGSPSGTAGSADWNQIGPGGPGPGAGRGGGREGGDSTALRRLQHHFGLMAAPRPPQTPCPALCYPGCSVPGLASSLDGGCCWAWPCPQVPAAAPNTSMCQGEDTRCDISHLAAWLW